MRSHIELKSYGRLITENMCNTTSRSSNLMGLMFYYIDKPHIPSFSTRLAKTKSDFIVRLVVEADLGR